MTSKNVNGTSTTFTFNAANELTQATGGISKTYSYDSNGQLTSESNGMTLTHNAAGQTTSITPPSGSAENMTYSGVGQGERTANATTTSQYDSAGVSQQTTGSTTTTLTTLPDGTPLSEYVGGATYSYLTDAAASTVALTNTSGAVKDAYSYDPTGNITSSTTPVANPFTYEGGQYDSSSGLYYMPGGSYYDPHTKQGVEPGRQPCACGTMQQNAFYTEGAPGAAYETAMGLHTSGDPIIAMGSAEDPETCAVDLTAEPTPGREIYVDASINCDGDVIITELSVSIQRYECAWWIFFCNWNDVETASGSIYSLEQAASLVKWFGPFKRHSGEYRVVIHYCVYDPDEDYSQCFDDVSGPFSM